MRNRHLSLEVQPSHINNGLYTTDGTEEHINSLLSPGSASSLNCLPLSQYDATNGKQEFMQKALPSLKNVYGETCSGKRQEMSQTHHQLHRQSFSAVTTMRVL